MTLIAATGLAVLVPILVALACPLMMIFMMRGMHGHGGHGAHGHHGPSGRSLDELKAERDALNEEIGRRAEESLSR